MARIFLRAIVSASVVVLLAATVLGQGGRQSPRAGFVYPAGGRLGETFEVLVGGQYLKDAEVTVSGDGVRAEVLEYIAPPQGKELQTLREISDQARKQAREAAGGKWPAPQAVRRILLELAKEKGITEKQLQAFERFNQQRNDPKRQLNPQLAEALKVRVSVSPGAAAGVRELRVLGRLGLSNPLRFHVGPLPEWSETESNDSQATANAVAGLPAVLNGQIMPGDVDYWRLSARRGQKLVIRIAARALVPYLADAVPGWFQATATLYDAAGRQVAYADDYRFDPDPVLLFEVPQDGEYVLEIRDSIFRGREDFVYRASVGELPFITSAFPLGVKRGEKTTVSLQGWNLPADKTKIELTPDRVGIEQLSVPGAAGLSNAVPLAVDDVTEFSDREPNDQPSQAMEVTLPAAINGRIDRPGDWDVVRFRAAEGQVIEAQVLARRLGSPLDSLIRITSAAGDVLGMNDDCEDKCEGLLTHHADSMLTVTIPKTGDYLLWIGDTQRQGGATMAYRLKIGLRQPAFALRVTPSALNARGGTSASFTVFAVREGGFEGDIDLSLADAPKGFALTGGKIPAGQDKVQLTLRVPNDPGRKIIPLVMTGVGRAADGSVIRAEAVPADDMMQAFAYHHLVPAEAWLAAIEPNRPNPPSWKIETPTPLRLVAGGDTTLRVRSTGRPPFGQVQVTLGEPPEGVSVKSVSAKDTLIEIVLQTDAEKAKVGVKGNLVFTATAQRDPLKNPPPAPAATPDAKAPPPGGGANLRVPLGVLPAVPFEIVAGNKAKA